MFFLIREMTSAFILLNIQEEMLCSFPCPGSNEIVLEATNNQLHPWTKVGFVWKVRFWTNGILDFWENGNSDYSYRGWELVITEIPTQYLLLPPDDQTLLSLQLYPGLMSESKGQCLSMWCILCCTNHNLGSSPRQGGHCACALHTLNQSSVDKHFLKAHFK